MDSTQMLRECGQLRGHVVAALTENENVRRLLEGATVDEEVAGMAGPLDEGALPSCRSLEAGGQP